MHLRRQITQDSISASKNAGVFFCRIWQIMQMTTLITSAGLRSSQPYPNFVRESVELLDSYDWSLDIGQMKTFSAGCASDHI